MATRTFEIRTEPHEATLGDRVFYFEPEVVGAEFAGAYNKLREVQERTQGSKANSSKAAKSADPNAIIEISSAMKSFVATFLVPGEQVDIFSGMRLPDRVLVQLIEWLGELYGGGSGNGEAGGTSTG